MRDLPPNQTLESFPPIQASKTAIPADANVRHLRTTLALDLAQHISILIACAAFIGILGASSSEMR